MLSCSPLLVCTLSRLLTFTLVGKRVHISSLLYSSSPRKYLNLPGYQGTSFTELVSLSVKLETILCHCPLSLVSLPKGKNRGLKSVLKQYWALNLGHLACQASAIPLCYSPSLRFTLSLTIFSIILSWHRKKIQGSHFTWGSYLVSLELGRATSLIKLWKRRVRFKETFHL